jgi:hypothetical protein
VVLVEKENDDSKPKEAKQEPQSKQMKSQPMEAMPNAGVVAVQEPAAEVLFHCTFPILSWKNLLG